MIGTRVLPGDVGDAPEWGNWYQSNHKDRVSLLLVTPRRYRDRNTLRPGPYSKPWIHPQRIRISRPDLPPIGIEWTYSFFKNYDLDVRQVSFARNEIIDLEGHLF